MRYLINIIGPQAVGKSTVIEELKEYLPDYRILAIDDFRRQYDSSTPEGEMRAWAELLRWCGGKKIIIESSGTSNNLLHVIGGMSAFGSIKVCTVLLEANVMVLNRRLIERNKKGYIAPKLYFDATYLPYRDAVVPVTIKLHTDTEQPYEVAAQIYDLLPSEFV